METKIHKKNALSINVQELTLAGQAGQPLTLAKTRSPILNSLCLEPEDFAPPGAIGVYKNLQKKYTG